jgi:mycothiol synthase
VLTAPVGAARGDYRPQPCLANHGQARLPWLALAPSEPVSEPVIVAAHRPTDSQCKERSVIASARASGATGDELEVVVLEGDDHLREVEALLADAEDAAGLPLVDEAEQERLAELAAGTPRPATWRSALLRRDGHAVAYTAVTTEQRPGTATGDVAVRRPIRAADRVTARTLAVARGLGADLGAPHVQVWMRGVGPAELEATSAAGFSIERRLLVLGRALPGEDRRGADARERLQTEGTDVRAYLPDHDDAEVVAVLTAAYAGTDDAGWDLARFGERRGWSWFRPEDLLVAAESDGRLAGLHWLKRRGTRTGEVYNLAVHPRAQGRGVGPALLHAGLEHLSALGCREVVLWVDAANERAVRLYQQHGFVTRWQDIAVGSETEVTGSDTEVPGG